MTSATNTRALRREEARRALVGCIEDLGDPVEPLDEADVSQIAGLLDLVTVLYGRVAEQHLSALLSQRFTATTTESVTTAAALLEYQELSVFEFNLWHARIEHRLRTDELAIEETAREQR